MGDVEQFPGGYKSQHYFKGRQRVNILLSQKINAIRPWHYSQCLFLVSIQGWERVNVKICPPYFYLTAHNPPTHTLPFLGLFRHASLSFSLLYFVWKSWLVIIFRNSSWSSSPFPDTCGKPLCPRTKALVGFWSGKFHWQPQAAMRFAHLKLNMPQYYTITEASSP